jgi:hypothetical protein
MNHTLNSADVTPALLLAGAKCQSLEVGIDAVRVTLRLRCLEAVRVLLSDTLGISEPIKAVPHLYREGVRFGCGASLLWRPGEADAAGNVCVELKGVSILALGQDGLGRLARSLDALGCRCTRLDVRADFSGEVASTLLDEVEAACGRGELRHARRWRSVKDYDGVELCGRGVYIGRRGENGSGRFVRVYDKGLEKGEFPAGQLVRWELEASADVAVQLWADYVSQLGSTPEAVSALLSARVLGAVDFRSPGRLDRSSRAGWWERVLSLIGDVVLCKARRKVSRLAGHVAWLRRAVVPKLAACAKASGQEFAAVVAELLSCEGIRPASLGAVVVQEYAALKRAASVVVESLVPRPVACRYAFLDLMR